MPEDNGFRKTRGSKRKVPEQVESLEYQLVQFITEVLVPGFEAKKTVYFTHKGVVTDSREVPDHERRLRCLDCYCELLGSYG